MVLVLVASKPLLLPLAVNRWRACTPWPRTWSRARAQRSSTLGTRGSSQVGWFGGAGGWPSDPLSASKLCAPAAGPFKLHAGDIYCNASTKLAARSAAGCAVQVSTALTFWALARRTHFTCSLAHSLARSLTHVHPTPQRADRLCTLCWTARWTLPLRSCGRQVSQQNTGVPTTAAPPPSLAHQCWSPPLIGLCWSPPLIGLCACLPACPVRPPRRIVSAPGVLLLQQRERGRGGGARSRRAARAHL